MNKVWNIIKCLFKIKGEVKKELDKQMFVSLVNIIDEYETKIKQLTDKYEKDRSRCVYISIYNTHYMENNDGIWVLEEGVDKTIKEELDRILLKYLNNAYKWASKDEIQKIREAEHKEYLKKEVIKNETKKNID